ncbi:hypothetical protein TWF481_007057 [Arthrobotrys musiformis]|uniref:Uncharacterized protein n=1 Tax=Arthrobotrys musiformis TaxID=47236 RepID=A0AAV9WC88_9PEZI
MTSSRNQDGITIETIFNDLKREIDELREAINELEVYHNPAQGNELSGITGGGRAVVTSSDQLSKTFSGISSKTNSILENAKLFIRMAIPEWDNLDVQPSASSGSRDKFQPEEEFGILALSEKIKSHIDRLADLRTIVDVFCKRPPNISLKKQDSTDLDRLWTIHHRYKPRWRSEYVLSESWGPRLELEGTIHEFETRDASQEQAGGVLRIAIGWPAAYHDTVTFSGKAYESDPIWAPPYVKYSDDFYGENKQINYRSRFDFVLYPGFRYTNTEFELQRWGRQLSVFLDIENIFDDRNHLELTDGESIYDDIDRNHLELTDGKSIYDGIGRGCWEYIDDEIIYLDYIDRNHLGLTDDEIIYLDYINRNHRELTDGETGEKAMEYEHCHVEKKLLVDYLVNHEIWYPEDTAFWSKARSKPRDYVLMLYLTQPPCESCQLFMRAVAKKFDLCIGWSCHDPSYVFRDSNVLTTYINSKCLRNLDSDFDVIWQNGSVKFRRYPDV